jgi:membrane protein YdbS with pleckstrin-like domain
MFKLIRQGCEALFRIPPEPGPPPGDEASTRVFRAAPGFLRYLRLFWGIGTAVGLGVALVLLTGALIFKGDLQKSNSTGATLLILAPVLLLLFFVVSRLVRLAVIQLDYEKRWYVVTDRSLRIREGVVNVQEMTITFANIQNIEVQQGPLQRLFRIADLRVDTAGGSSAPQPGTAGGSLHTALFRGIDNADEVKTLIQHRLRGLKDAGLGDHDDLHPTAVPSAPDADVLAALRLVLAEAKALRAAAAAATR